MRSGLLANGLAIISSCGVLSLACSTGPEGDVSGLWDVTETLSSQTGISCNMTGEILLSQSSNSGDFSGQLARPVDNIDCTNAPATFENRLSGVHNTLNGKLSGLGVTFDLVLCQYEGTLAEPAMSGTMECEEDPNQTGETVIFTGTWQATRK